MRKIVVNLIDGRKNTVTVDATTLELIEAAASVEEVIAATAEILGQSPSDERTMKFNIDGIGWVAFNPAHVVSVEFHGTEDVE